MANLITPISLLPKNALAGMASDYTGSDPVTLLIGNASVPDYYFRGVFYKKPNEAYLGVDVSRYIRDICTTENVHPYADTFENAIIGVVGYYRVRMYNSSDVLIFDYTGYVHAGTPTLTDIMRLREGLPIGLYNEIAGSLATNIVTNGELIKYQAATPNWITDINPNITVSTFPLAADYYQLQGYEDTPYSYNALYYFNGFLNVAKKYKLSVKIRKVDAAAYVAVKFFGVDVSSRISNVERTITVDINGADIDESTVPMLDFNFRDIENLGTIRFRQLELIEYGSEWYNGTQYDNLMHNRIYTFDNLAAKSLNGVTWNKALIGAPVGISVWNPTRNELVMVGEVEYYGGDLTIAETQTFPILADQFFGRTVFYIGQSKTQYNRSAFTFKLGGNVNTRAVFIERINPCYGRTYYQVYYINRLAGIDWIIMSGKNYKRSTNSKKAYRIDNGEFEGGDFRYSPANTTKKNYIIETKETYELNSQIENETDYKWLEELVSSPAVWIWDNNTQQIQAVEITDNNFEFKNHWNNQVFNFKMSAETLNNSIR